MRYHVHFAADAAEPLPPVADLATVDADSPVAAVEALLQAGRYPQTRGLRWARVVVAFRQDGTPIRLARFPIHVADEGAAIDWNVGGEPAF